MTTTIAAWRNTSAYCAIYTERIPRPAFGGLDQSTRLVCIPLSRDQAEELARAQERDIQASLTSTGVIPASPVVHPSIRHAFLEGLVFAVLGTSLCWTAFILAIVAVRGIFG